MPTPPAAAAVLTVRSPARHSLRWRLPVLVALLIVGTLATFLVVTYTEVVQLLTRAGGVRAQAAAEQLASLLAPSAVQRMADLRRVAGNPAIATFLQHPDERSRAAADQTLRTLIVPGAQVIELWDRSGGRLLSIANPPEAVADLVSRERPTAPGLRLFESSKSLAVSQVAEGVPDTARANSGDLGYVVILRAVTTSANSDALNRLIGGGARIELGGRLGSWTDLSHVGPPPPIDLAHTGVTSYRADGDDRIGALREIAGTPWLIWVEFPRALLLAPARPFLRTMLLISLGFIVAAGVLSSLVTRRITTRLVALTEASEHVAEGQWPSAGFGSAAQPDEIGRLGVAFRHMVNELREAQQRLEAQVRERGAALDAVRESHERYRAIVDVALDCIITIDRDGLVTEFNPAAERTFGRRKADVIGRELAALIVPSRYQQAHREGLARLLTTGEGPVIGRLVELSAQHADGHEFPIEVAIQATMLHGQPMFTAYLRDISERQRAEATRVHAVELEVENRRVREATRLKSEFLANMSHELRTPLNAIIGFSSILKDSPDITPVLLDEFVGHILTGGRHLLQLINDILDLSKVEAGKLEFRPEPIDLEDLIAEVRNILDATARAHEIELHVSVDPAVAQVQLDPARLKQVLYNYLSNALKFTPPHGRVTVRVQPDGTDAFRLEVEDSGVGIAPGDLGKLFVEFQQLDTGVAKQHSGTGLGLALTKRLVEAQGGTVGVRSTPGVGSVFHAVLPRQYEAPALAAVPEPIAGPIGAPAALVIEDDADDRRRIVDALAAAGFAVESVATGREAVERCRQRAFDAVTVDLLLPDQSGLDVIAQIRLEAKNPDVPVVVVTVVTEQQTLMGHVVSDILRKPLDGDALLASLRRVGVQPRSPRRILVVDDDEASVRLLTANLDRAGFVVEGHTDPRRGLASARAVPPAAIILDLAMPELDGFQFLDALRASAATLAIPVVVWTVHDLSSLDRRRLMASIHSVHQKGLGDVDSLIAEIRQALVRAEV